MVMMTIIEMMTKTMTIMEIMMTKIEIMMMKIIMEMMMTMDGIPGLREPGQILPARPLLSQGSIIQKSYLSKKLRYHDFGTWKFTQKNRKL